MHSGSHDAPQRPSRRPRNMQRIVLPPSSASRQPTPAGTPSQAASLQVSRTPSSRTAATAPSNILQSTIQKQFAAAVAAKSAGGPRPAAAPEPQHAGAPACLQQAITLEQAVAQVPGAKDLTHRPHAAPALPAHNDVVTAVANGWPGMPGLANGGPGFSAKPAALPPDSAQAAQIQSLFSAAAHGASMLIAQLQLLPPSDAQALASCMRRAGGHNCQAMAAPVRSSAVCSAITVYDRISHHCVTHLQCRMVMLSSNVVAGTWHALPRRSR